MRAPWTFDSGRLLYINSLMTEEERDIFFIDLKKVDPRQNYVKMLLGLQKYMLGQDVVHLDDGYR